MGILEKSDQFSIPVSKEWEEIKQKEEKSIPNNTIKDLSKSGISTQGQKTLDTFPDEALNLILDKMKSATIEDKKILSSIEALEDPTEEKEPSETTKKTPKEIAASKIAQILSESGLKLTAKIRTVDYAIILEEK